MDAGRNPGEPGMSWRGAMRSAILALVALAGSALPAGAGLGGTVTVLGVWGGQELDAFHEMVKPFEAQTGVRVAFAGTRDLDAVLTTRVAAGNLPDLAVLPGPAKLAELAAQGKLVDLATVLDMTELRAAFGPDWIALGSANHHLLGIFAKAALKGLVWYRPQALKDAHVQVPESLDQLMGESGSLAARGTTPWAMGLESGSTSGWAGADWLETLFLRMYGPEVYTDWYQGRLAWTSSEMRAAWQAWGRIAGDPAMVYGGSPYVLSTAFGHAFAPVFQDPPRALLHFQGSFIQAFIRKQFPKLIPGEDFDFFPFPAIRPEFARAVVVAGDLLAMFRRTPQSEAFVRYLASAPAQAFWARTASGLSANRNVPLDLYPDPVSRKAAAVLTQAQGAVFGAGDMMPSEMSRAFWSACMSFVANPADLDAILAALETVRKDAYQLPGN